MDTKEKITHNRQGGMESWETNTTQTTLRLPTELYITFKKHLLDKQIPFYKWIINKMLEELESRGEDDKK